MTERSIWAKTTLEELLSRQSVANLRADRAFQGEPVRAVNQGAFRPGLRVVAIEDNYGIIPEWPANLPPSAVVIEG